MEINKEIEDILRENKVDVQSGTLVLLGIYFKLDVRKICPEEIIKAINTTKIVEIDYRLGGIIKWNTPLFKEQQTQWGWVDSWNEGFGKFNKSRKDNLADVTKRMVEFFQKHPQYRIGDVMKARDAYFSTVKDSQYLKSSAKFIFEGAAGNKTSMLLTWCERVTTDTNNYMVGKVVT